MSTQKCFRCGKVLALRCFYRHPEKANGRLGKCKECTKEDVRANRNKRQDYYRRKDRERRRGKHPPKKRDWRARKKATALRMVRAAIKAGLLVRSPCEVCGNRQTQGHHNDYDLPLSVRWLCSAHHQLWHSHNKAKGI